MSESNGNEQHLVAPHRCVLVCQNTSCLRQGSDKVLAALQAYQVPNVTVNGSECMGQCSSGPTVRVLPDETWYCRVSLTDVPILVEQHLLAGKLVEAKLHPRIHLRFSY